MRNQTTQEVEAGLHALEGKLAQLQAQRTRLLLLNQFLRQGVTQPNSVPFTSGNAAR